MRTTLPALLVMVAACATPTPPPAAPAPRLASGQSLGDAVGSRVEVVGHPANEIWQHLIGSVTGKQPAYFDLDGGDQIVVHVAQAIDCPGDVAVTGTVLEVRGPSKRPAGTGETKAADAYVEYALDVDGWRCLPTTPARP